MMKWKMLKVQCCKCFSKLTDQLKVIRLCLLLLMEWPTDFNRPQEPRPSFLLWFPLFGLLKTVGLLSTVSNSLLNFSKLTKSSTQRWTCSCTDLEPDSITKTTKSSTCSSNKRNSKLLLLLLTKTWENNARENTRAWSRLSRSSSTSRRTCEAMRERRTPPDIWLSTKPRRGPWTLSMTAWETASSCDNKSRPSLPAWNQTHLVTLVAEEDAHAKGSDRLFSYLKEINLINSFTIRYNYNLYLSN